MNTPRSLVLAGATAIVLLGAVLFAPTACAQGHTFAIEINDVLCGYAEVVGSEAETDGQQYTRVDHKVFASVSLLGSAFDLDIETTLHVAPVTGRITFAETRVTKGDSKEEMRVFIENDEARFVYPLDGTEKTVALPPDIILDNPLGAPYLVRDFVQRGVASMSYPVLALQEAKVQNITYTRSGEETLELAGASHTTLILDALIEETGFEMRQWIDIESGMTLKMTLPGGRLIYLANPSIKKRIEIANLDSTISAKTNVVIADVPSISFMKVRAVLEPVGLRLTPADLNVPGQRFEGTVTGNHVEGVFTIEHPRYDGTHAPPFPVDHAADEALAEFLASDPLIQSDDPVLTEQAQRITAGARDSWDAARRLGRWVSDNIDYAIPGGGSARKTYDTRAGECGAHSMLLAGFCRSVGIPARVAWGCMYVPNFGGSFAQHGWTEVHMGKAGWIPVDATAKENDFVDSGHIRVGHFRNVASAINLVEAEVLDYRLRTTGTNAEPIVDHNLERFVGRYAHPSGRRTYDVQLKEGGLALITPEKVVVGLRSPDDSGRRYAKMTSRIYCTFPQDEHGAIAALTIHEIQRMRRQPGADPVAESVPSALRPYLGDYRLAALRANFEVRHQDGGLGVYYPSRKRVIRFEPAADEGRFFAEFVGHTIWFERDEAGAGTSLLLDAGNRFDRQEPAAEQQPEPAHPEVAAVTVMLLDFHRAASDADAERYFAHLAPDAILMGTAAEERWTVAQLEALLTPSFAEGIGFTTLPTAQHVYLAADGNIAWFDENLRSARWGPMRGSGVARKIDGTWKIVHYNRAFTVPNELVPDLVKQIDALSRK